MAIHKESHQLRRAANRKIYREHNDANIVQNCINMCRRKMSNIQHKNMPPHKTVMKLRLLSGAENCFNGQHGDIELTYLISSWIMYHLIYSYICNNETMTDTIIYLRTASKSIFLWDRQQDWTFKWVLYHERSSSHQANMTSDKIRDMH
jgi:hypothetical protein